MMKTTPRSATPFHSFAPELAALEWTEEGELAAAARCQMVQRLLEAESQPENQVELIRASQPWCIKGNGEPPPQPDHPHWDGWGVSSGRRSPDHRGYGVPPSE
ncbi:MAG: hypothetical protein OXF67_00575 [Cyanobacteria bacterium MAG CAR4_bin_6]|nr:hypothetical protein [Cyanobacteria bacterium MAG CAR4_bin_6]